MCHRPLSTALAATLLIALTGCWHHDSGPAPISPAAFAAHAEPAYPTTTPATPLDRATAIPIATVQEGPRVPTAASLDPVLNANVVPPGTTITPAPGTTATPAPRPQAAPAPGAPAPAGISTGQYLLLGGVVAEANGAPIYANKVLRLLYSPLSTKARELDAQRFRGFALDLIRKQVGEFIRAELEFAAAQRYLDDDDKNMADALTMQWRARQITEAGGSAEVARRRALADGNDFDDLVQQQYRVYMTQIFYQKRVIPKIQVSANDLRRYYDRNRDAEFSERAQVRFRLVKVSVREAGSRAAALKLATDLYNRAKAGEDFAAIAAAVNDDPALKRKGGDVGVIDRDSFAIEKVEKAVWTIKEGQITEPIDDGDAFYVAKLESLKLGKTESFEDQAVQDRIRGKLRSNQFRMLREQIQATLEKNAVIRWDENLLQTAVDMAMQEYPRWAAR